MERVELARGSDRRGTTPGGAKLRTVVAPLVRRQDLTSPENATRVQAEIRRRFEAAGVVNAGWRPT